MTSQRSAVTSKFLQERVAYLEESNQRYMLILEMLASSSQFQGDLSRAKDAEGIFKATTSQLRRLFSFQSLGFLDSQSDGSFELLVTDPASAHDDLQALVEARMMDGTFAWALNRNQAIFFPTEGGENLVLQVVATQSRVRGMFVGVLPCSLATLDAPSLNALSIVLYTCAYAMESNYLYGMLRDHTQHLEERVQIRTRDLEDARRQAESASMAKSDFLANMSHEIRTPMNGVMGMTALLLQGGVSPQKEQQYLHAIKDSADSLMLIINDILDFSKIEAGKFTLERIPFCPRDAVQRCLDGLLVRAEEKGLAVTYQIDPAVPAVIVGDQGRLRQVLTNLVGNAIKFCQQGNISVAVGLDSIDERAVLLHIRVTDTGIGIAEEACQRIFNQFEQADCSTTRKFGGTGLGLAICKKLVDLMGGSIWVESRLGSGSCFHFTARFQLGSTESLPAATGIDNVSTNTRFAPLRILLADDVEINRALVMAILEPYGHQITTAEHGRMALDAYKSSQFDLVLMDVQMPEMDGLQATRAIRDYERTTGQTSPVPIVAMTAFAGSEDRQICLDAGMNDYVTKPVKPALLLQVFARLCAHPLQSVETPTTDGPSSPPQVSHAEDFDQALAIFDQNELLERLGGRSDMIPRFVGFFCKDAVPQLEGLRSALTADNTDGVRRHAHAIKGAAGNISAPRMQSMAAKIEHVAKEGDLTDAHHYIAQLKIEFRAFLDAISALGLSGEAQ